MVEARSNESKNMVDLHNKTKIYASFLQLSLMLDCEIHKIFLRDKIFIFLTNIWSKYIKLSLGLDPYIGFRVLAFLNILYQPES